MESCSSLWITTDSTSRKNHPRFTHQEYLREGTLESEKSRPQTDIPRPGSPTCRGTEVATGVKDSSSGTLHEE